MRSIRSFQRSLSRWWFAEHFELRFVGALDKLNGMCWTNASAALAQSAISNTGGEIGLDRIERTNLNTLIAVNAGRFDLSFGNPEDIADRENGTAGTYILAPKSWLQET